MLLALRLGHHRLRRRGFHLFDEVQLHVDIRDVAHEQQILRCAQDDNLEAIDSPAGEIHQIVTKELIRRPKDLLRVVITVTASLADRT